MNTTWLKVFIPVTLALLLGVLIFGTTQLSNLNNKVSSLNDEVVKLVILSVDSEPPAGGLIEGSFESDMNGGSHFFIDPINGSASGDGTLENPWQSLQEVIDNKLIQSQAIDVKPYDPAVSKRIDINTGAPIRGGDTIYLMDGQHGDVSILGYLNEKPILVKNYPGHTPVLSSIKLAAVDHWIFEGLTIKRSDPVQPKEKILFQAVNHNWHGPSGNVTLSNSYLTSADDVDDWSSDDWNNKTSDAIASAAKNTIIKNNVIENVSYGIKIFGSNALVEHNEINRFAGDALRGLGNYGVFQYNTIKNSIQVNDNHDDAFQSWARDGKSVKGIKFHGNTIIAFEDPNQPFAGYLQGVGLHDGPFEGFTITNNIIIVESWNGISLSEITESIVMNNTVVDADFATRKAPSITVRDGSENNLIHNNIARNVASYKLETYKNSLSNNAIISPSDVYNIFQDYEGHDFRLRSGSPLINAGNTNYAPQVDAEGNIRIGRPDIGALEYQP